MILYLDSSAIVKLFVVETGSAEIRDAVVQSEIIGTCVVSRAEVIAAFQKAVRVGALREETANGLKKELDRGWPSLVRTKITERLVHHASELAWIHGLRGYDAVQLASAAAWQQALGRVVTVATFDKALWTAALDIELKVFPARIPGAKGSA